MLVSGRIGYLEKLLKTLPQFHCKKFIESFFKTCVPCLKNPVFDNQNGINFRII